MKTNLQAITNQSSSEVIKILETNNFYYEVKVNTDGTLLITYVGESKSIDNAGLLIHSMGGIDKVLARCKDYMLEEWETKLKTEQEKLKADRKAARENLLNRRFKYQAQHEADYKALLEKNEVIETTVENIGIVLRYLNDCNWGSWELPKMTIGYSCSQYDCDGKQATTMILDTPIDMYGKKVNKLQVGAPRGHLVNYHRVW